jgi:replicative DNA helicase
MSIDHEEGLIGGLLARPDLLPDAQAIVADHDFTSAALGDSFEWLKTAKLRGGGDYQDRVHYLEWATKKKIKFDLKDAGQSHADAARRITEYTHGGFVEYHAKSIANEAIFRRLSRVSHAVAESIAGHDDGKIDDASQCLQAVAEIVADIQTKSARGEAVEMRKAVSMALAEIESRLYGQTRIGLPTGFATLDRMLSGLRPGELVILAARPGVGKSALAGNIAANVCQGTGGRVLFSSLEMSHSELVERMLSSECGVDHAAMRLGNLTASHRSAIVEAGGRLCEWDLAIDDRPNQRVADIVAQARRKQMRGGLDLVVVDYLQLIQPQDHRVPRQEQVSAMSRGLKAAAKSLKVPILCLAQLNRQADTPNEVPRLSHLRESGAIEQDADVVLFIHQEPRSDDKPADAAKLVIAKQRNGPTGEINLAWYPHKVTFCEQAGQRCDALPRTVDLPHELDSEGADYDSYDARL